MGVFLLRRQSIWEGRRLMLDLWRRQAGTLACWGIWCLSRPFFLGVSLRPVLLQGGGMPAAQFCEATSASSAALHLQPLDRHRWSEVIAFLAPVGLYLFPSL